MMKKTLTLILLVTLTALVFNSCGYTETYAEKRERENKTIAEYIKKQNINVISEAQFHQQNDSTSIPKNEYVLFETSGVYMQIVNRGCGERIKENEEVRVICRYNEYNILGDSLQSSNISMQTNSFTDVMNVYNYSGAYYGIFVPETSWMYQLYKSTSVPESWLVPMPYVNIGRDIKEDDALAEVKLIVPSAKGQQYAVQEVYPCLYEIRYKRGAGKPENNGPIIK